jgi:uncharacterized membrane protein YdbT with pleckstrin-like domain
MQKDDKILYKGQPNSKTIGYLFISNLFIWVIIFTTFSVMFSIIFFVVRKTTGDMALNYLKIPFVIINSVFGIIFIITILSFLYRIPLLKTYKYYVTNHHVILEKGLLSKTKKSVPLGKITDITITQGFLERIFKISRLHIQTAGTNLTEIVFFGLSDAGAIENILSKLLKKK